ncbi:uncharacterized protein LOC109709868 [Ananas comosus]|uniref:Uncharacterized protein LOC109709868 n=1 Tax=Ananas comosus TaxID=4615 RepID=A0A6P5EVJ0_ANACO|nr:uncharacterized protein LOC109709868 [Ananas comosus]
MAEGVGDGAKIRVVRCPKCEKLLPELPNYSVYLCGGCGATLQAKKQNPASDVSSDKSDGENVKYLEVLENCSAKKKVISEANSETDAEGDKVEYLREGRSLPDNSSSQNDANGALEDPGTSKLGSPFRENSCKRKEIKEKGEAQPPVEGRERFRCTSYPDEGPSDYHFNSKYMYAGAEHGQSRVGHLEQDRAELLRMLDELRDQVQRSCEVGDKQNASAHASRSNNSSSSYGPYDRVNWLPQRLSSLNRNASRRSPSLNGHNFYSSVPQHEISNYGRAPFHPSGQRTRRPEDNYFYGCFDPDPLISYHHEGFYHQPACSCLHCHQPEFVNHQRVPYVMNNHPMLTSQSYSPRGMNATFARNHRNTNFSKKAGYSCQPIVGAAPFTICFNCHELLRLPEESLIAEKNQFQMRCGSCSHAMLVKLDGSRLVILDTSPISPIPSENNDDSIDSPQNYALGIDEKLLPSYNFSFNREVLEREHQLNSSASEKMQVLSSSSSLSGHVESPGTSNSQKELPPEEEVISRVPSLPLREHFGYLSADQVVDGPGKGSRSKRSEQEKVVLLAETLKQSSVKDVPVATEMDLSPDEYPDPGLSQDSFDLPRYEDQPRNVKGGDSFLSNLIKKSFRVNQSVVTGKSKVSINGYPISDRVVKKAEKQAGPICPGEYWYDYRAGFWGVMGQPCLGIIPPFIDEFNYPISKNCAAGNTGVLVNGRELHQKDLDLLIGRGLPGTAGQSYRIEISGKVWDEASGEELDCLGKLAPTVEKMKRGFGMRAPRVIA